MSNLLQSEFEFFLLCISTLFPLINPLGVTPIFLSMTDGYNHNERIAIAKKGVLTGTVVLIIFALFGSVIFKFFTITIEAFQIMGGIIFFRSGLNMLEAKVGRTRTTLQEQEEFIASDEFAYTPIGIPLITGPGAITGAMLLSGQSETIANFAILTLSIILVMITVMFILFGGERLSRKMGVAGMRIIQRIMGLILMVIATQFIINGLTVILRNMIN